MTEAERNAETVRRGYAAFNAADMKTLTELFDENASWHAGAELHRGRPQGARGGVHAIRPLWGRDGRDLQGHLAAGVQGR
jgi:ketosteroid isomerase-like protein